MVERKQIQGKIIFLLSLRSPEQHINILLCFPDYALAYEKFTAIMHSKT